MKKIKIEGKFTNKVNNYVRIDVYRPNPGAYDFSKSYQGDFSETIADLEEGTDYQIDITGFTFAEFKLNITGQFLPPNPIQQNFKKTDFKPGFMIKTRP